MELWLTCVSLLPFFFLQQPKERLQEEWMREKRELERKVAELQAALQKERRVRKKKKKSVFF